MFNSKLFGGESLRMFNQMLGMSSSPFGGNYRGCALKNGSNPKAVAKRRAKNKNKKTHRN